MSEPPTFPRPDTSKYDDELLARLAKMEQQLDRASTETVSASTGTRRGAVVLLALVTGGLFAFNNCTRQQPVVTQLPPPAALMLPAEPVSDVEQVAFSEQQYLDSLRLTQERTEHLLNQLHCITTEQFLADARTAVSEQGVSERAAIAQKLNFSISRLHQAIEKRGFFGGDAKSRADLRAPLMDLYAALLALQNAPADGCVLEVAQLLDSASELSSWLDRAEATRREWQLKQPAPEKPPLPVNSVMEVRSVPPASSPAPSEKPQESPQWNFGFSN